MVPPRPSPLVAFFAAAAGLGLVGAPATSPRAAAASSPEETPGRAPHRPRRAVWLVISRQLPLRPAASYIGARRSRTSTTKSSYIYITSYIDPCNFADVRRRVGARLIRSVEVKSIRRITRLKFQTVRPLCRSTWRSGTTAWSPPRTGAMCRNGLGGYWVLHRTGGRRSAGWAQRRASARTPRRMSTMSPRKL